MGKKSKKKSPDNRTRAEKTPPGSVKAAAFFRKPVAHILIIVILGTLIYSNTFNTPFVLDDIRVIVNSAAIRDIHHMINPLNMMYGNRHVGLLSLALNYNMHGLNVVGYHIFNLFIHLLSSLFVYWLMILTFKTPYVSSCFQNDALKTSDFYRWIPLFTALLFVSHPIQTQAVIYIVQRFASLATLFCLVSLVMYIKARGSDSSKRERYAFYAASIISAVLAMRTKEIAFTLPIMVLLYEFIFFTGDIRKRVLFLILMLLTMFMIPLSMIAARGGSAGAGFIGIDELTKLAGAVDVSRWDYLNTQFRVIVTYIRLLFLPVNQNLDYDYAIYRNFFSVPVFLSFLFLLGIFCWGIYLLYRSCKSDQDSRCWHRLMAFGIFWFFVTLSVESSIIPIVDVIFEHRVYLPSIGFFMTIMSATALIRMKFADRVKVANAFMLIMILTVIGLSFTAYARNMVWRDALTLWEDTVKKSPDKLRPRQNLGEAYQRQGRFEDAIREYQTAIKLNPDYLLPHNNLGMVYEMQGRLDDAIREYQTAIKLNPDFPLPHNNLAAAYQMQGHFDDAVREYQTAIKLNPEDAEYHYNLGMVHQIQGRLDDAIKEYQNVLKLKPDHANAHSDLGAAYHKQGRLDDAVKEYQAAIKIKPDHAQALNNLRKINRPVTR